MPKLRKTESEQKNALLIGDTKISINARCNGRTWQHRRALVTTCTANESATVYIPN